MTMGATTTDLLGGSPTPEAAIAGSYGEPPRGFCLPEATRLGAVQLQVADLARSLTFYEGVLGLRVISRDHGRVVLGAHGDERGEAQRPLVELHELVGARPAATRGRLGLYHVALLLPERASLGRFVRHLGDIGARAGAGDHLVSEAFYLTDPDGLGIEVYADRPRDTWRRIGRELMLATDPVDVAGLAQSAGDAPWRGMPPDTVIGHVHLHVGDLERAAAFYGDALGFDRMTWRYPGALFLGAGGYHHHVAANTWAGTGARPPLDDEARLLAWTIELPDTASLEAAAQSLADAGHAVKRPEAGDVHAVMTRDPWGTPVRLQVVRTNLP
jgi:catechol 2,3-dioxygenase